MVAMRRRRADVIKVGLFVVVAGAILAGGLLWIAGSHLLRPVDTYTVLFRQSVSGLNAGANVEYQGVVVGRVRDIQLTRDIPPNVAVIIDIDPGTPIRQDTAAALLGSIVTGIKFIQLEGGSAAAEPLAAGGTIPGDVSSLEEFRDRLTKIADRAVRILNRLDEDIFTPANTKKVSQFVSDLGAVASSVNQAMEYLRAEETSKNLAQIAQRMNELTVKLDLVVGDFYGRREQLYGNLESALRHMDEVARDARDLVRTVSTQVDRPGGSLGDLVAGLTEATNRLQETIDVIRSDPSVVLWGRPVPERELER